MSEPRGMSMKDNLISELSGRYGKDKTDKLLRYMQRILEINEHINLTAVREEDEFLEKHIVDSLACNDYEEFQRSKLVVDMGTGGGFPGIPLAVTNPDKKFILADSLNKRLKVINQVAEELGISNIELIHMRAEDMGHNVKYREKIDVCVSRAVASLDILSEWCLPLVKKGGYFIPYKGENAEDETASAETAIKVLGGDIEKIESPSQDKNAISGHRLIFIKKYNNTPKRFPRKPGIAKKSPIR
ncbi:16S rRNA (guanine(527)-N(7))-methyltransferase RsmG [Mogibacterium sp.]